MHQGGQFLGQRALGEAGGRALGGLALQLLDLRLRAEAEDPQEVGNVPVVRVQPELVEGVRGGQLGVEPDRAGLRLAELGAVRLDDQRRGQRVHGLAVGLADQVRAGREVAPLVAAAGLQRAAVAAVQLQVVHALEDLVAELGVADARVGVQPSGDGLLGDHVVDAEVLAHVAQQADRGHPGGPVQVVDHARRVRALEVEEPRDLAAQALDPAGHRLGVVEHALGGGLRVADQTGGAADQAEREVPRLLDPAHGEDLDQVAEVQAGRRRVEAAIERDRAVRERLAQCVLVGGQGDQPTPPQLVDDVRHGHASPSIGRPPGAGPVLSGPGCGTTPAL